MRDFHCHILWGVDDGARSFEDSVAMLDAAAAAGVSTITCTPHMRWDNFDEAKVREHFALLQAPAAERGIRLVLGFEVYYFQLLKLGIERAREWVWEDGRNFLMEFNSGDPVPEGWREVVAQLQAMDLDVIIAHPERYATVVDDFDFLRELRAAGCRLQISASDLYKEPLGRRAEISRRMLDEGLCDMLVSDGHADYYFPHLARAVQEFGNPCPVE